MTKCWWCKKPTTKCNPVNTSHLGRKYLCEDCAKKFEAMYKEEEEHCNV